MPPPGLLGAAGFGHPADKSGFGRGAHLAGSAGQIWANRKSAEAPPRPLTPPRTNGQVELALGKELDFLSQAPGLRSVPGAMDPRGKLAPSDLGFLSTEFWGKSTKFWLCLILLFAVLLGFYSNVFSLISTWQREESQSQDTHSVVLQRMQLEKKESRANLGSHGSCSFPPERGSPQASLSPSGVESLWAELSGTKLPDRVSVSKVSLPCFSPLVLSPGHTAQALQPWGAFLSRGCGVMALGGSWPVWHGSASPSTLSPALSTLFSSLSERDCPLDTCRIPEVPRLVYPKAQLLKPTRVDVLVMTPWFAPII
ncbi:hypothetical protein J1605_017248 [Eschrichtius robustus]|uniref:Uncharacterized protein n=1 Tax=Eschrichtius robustus TaxID=9764 RepID=A0AB34HXH4_ESCRO|nr:hypothetical protein J1605_017248 [Eschrichtius robustus]